MSLSSFPTRVIRSFFGPKLEDPKPIKNPYGEVPAQSLNSMFWQVAGCGLVVARVQVIAEWADGEFHFDLRTEAWNAENDQPHPVLARTSAGVYTLTLAATYSDENGNAVQPDIAGAMCAAIGPQATFAARLEARAWVDGFNRNLIHIRVWDASGTAVDGPFWLRAA